MTDDIEQLLKNLHLSALAETVERELTRAQKQKPSYEAFYGRILREQYQLQKQKSMEYRIRAAGLPERWTLETFPFDVQTGVHAPTSTSRTRACAGTGPSTRRAMCTSTPIATRRLSTCSSTT